MASKAYPDYKKFEQLVAEIQQELSPDAKVTSNEKILGQSGVWRQVDITVRQTIGTTNILIMIECKDWATKLDVHDIEGIYGHSKDINANKCVVVSAKGYSDGAKKIARNLGVDLLSVADTRKHKWQQEIKIPIYYRLSAIEWFQLELSTHTPYFLELPYAPDATADLILYDGDKQPIDTIGNLLFKSSALDNLANGLNEKVNFLTQKVYILSCDNFHLFNITANIFIRNQTYLYETPISQIKGFIDEGADNLTIICNKGLSLRADLKKIFHEGKKVDTADPSHPKCTIRINATKTNE